MSDTSMPPSVMTSESVHPAEIAAEKDNITVDSQIVAENQTEYVVDSEIVAENQTEDVSVHSEIVAENQTEDVSVDSEIVAENQTDSFIIDTCNNVQRFIQVNNEKIQTLNNVLEQLTNLGLSDNSAIEHLTQQRCKYNVILEQIKSNFARINDMTEFIL